jgi:hypothetical protein
MIDTLHTNKMAYMLLWAYVEITKLHAYEA